jgi:hypothetical protein
MQRGNKLVQRITNACCFFVKREISGALFEGGDSINQERNERRKEEPTMVFLYERATFDQC